MERSLLYVSRPSPLMADPARTIAEIVAEARIANTRLGITGALAATQGYIAQLLEGPAVALEDLMGRIERDPRHTDVTILRVEEIAHRRLPAWSMAYSGTASYVTRQILPLIGARMEGDPAQIERLVSLLVGLASPASDARP